jgi:xanthine dehydrogenase molybdopterin-binding subunit B
MYAAAGGDGEVDRKTGVVKVPRVVMAADIGRVVNPDGAKNQLEGGIVQAVSLTLKEQVAFDRREITSRDWSGYPILTFREVPSVEVILMDRSDPSLGAGEGSLPPTSAALANAFAHATGRRLRELPMTPERVKASLSWRSLRLEEAARPVDRGGLVSLARRTRPPIDEALLAPIVLPVGHAVLPADQKALKLSFTNVK